VHILVDVLVIVTHVFALTFKAKTKLESRKHWITEYYTNTPIPWPP